MIVCKLDQTCTHNMCVRLVRLGNMEKLATMWYKKEVEGLPRPHCDQVLQDSFYCKIMYCKTVFIARHD
jgi:hypothetical protein